MLRFLVCAWAWFSVACAAAAPVAVFLFGECAAARRGDWFLGAAVAVLFTGAESAVLAALWVSRGSRGGSPCP